MNNEELFNKISDLVKTELNGKLEAKLDAKIQPIKDILDVEFSKLDLRLEKIESNIDANARSISELRDSLGQ